MNITKKIELHLVFFSQCLKIKAYTNQKQKEKTKFCAFCFHKLLFSLYNAVSCIFFWQLETSSNKLDICFVLRNSRKRQFFLYQNSSRLVTSPTIIRSGQELVNSLRVVKLSPTEIEKKQKPSDIKEQLFHI